MKKKVIMKKKIKRPTQSEDAEDLIPYLPSEIMLNILSRIPAQTVIRCKCVCKEWRDLLATREFVQSHLSRSVPGLAVYLTSKRYRIVEDEHSLNVAFSFDLPFLSVHYILHCSVNGLLFMCNRYPYDNPRSMFVCNPITREYITIPSPLEASSREASYGFGVSKMSGEYKVVRIRDAVDCQVYTVGSGSWRRIEFDDQLRYKRDTVGAFFNGNLHWLARKRDLICSLDLETERFSTFSPPPCCQLNYTSLSVLGDYLCVCHNFSLLKPLEIRGVDIWLMKEYGNDKSWTKQFHFGSCHCNNYYYPIKVFSDGDILMQLRMNAVVYCSNTHGRETIREVDLFKDFGSGASATIYAPSFLSLKTFSVENVSSFR